MKVKFYICKHCGNVVVKLVDSKVPVVCCGEPMHEMVAGETDGAMEKHVPVFKQEGNVLSVEVGSVLHPMTEEHAIKFIVAETNKGVHVKYLEFTDEPKAQFALLEGEEVLTVYEYCNLHGLWKA
ncbi:MAG: desulfoferrodoxin [Clostridia bacterium]|nr:desulfoferrodoxin [Clostridia bacterium]